MTQGTSNLAGFVEFHELVLKGSLRFKGEHGCLAASHDQCVEPAHINLGYPSGIFDERGEFRCRNEPHANKVGHRVLTRITRVAHRIRLALPSVGAKDLCLVAFFLKHKVRMCKFAPPESDRPTGGRGYRWI